MKFTRRKLVGAVIAGAALAQTQPAQSPPADPDEETKFVAAEAQRRAQELAEFPAPMAVEPAFEFKA